MQRILLKLTKKEKKKKKEDLNGFSWLSHSAMGENCGTYKSTLPIPFV